MTLGRLILRLLGRRLPVTQGTLEVEGLGAAVTVRRDGYGIPHIQAQGDEDAAFGLGFCQAQDRAFQLETLLRAGRGTLAELVGEEALPTDRLARRLGFDGAAAGQLDACSEPVRAVMEAYARGVNQGLARGTRRRPHEFALLRRDPTPWTAVDACAVINVVSFGLAGNWDMELGRLRVLELDGPDALRAVDPAYPSWLAVTEPPGRPAGTAADRLAEDLSALSAFVGAGGSNNWAIAGSRTATGRPLLANDPHLGPTLPPFWYLAHVRTREWEAAGATVVGAPGIQLGHNGFVAWGITNSGADVTDLFLEDPEDGSFQVREERIEVRGGDPVVERVTVTPRGPVVSPALEDGLPAISMRARWLDPLALDGAFGAQRSSTWEELRRAYATWPGAPLNIVGADFAGTIGWQLSGVVPRRERGSGLMPQPAAGAGSGWQEGDVPVQEMPRNIDPDAGWVATANNKPVADGAGPWLGADWMDGYRVQRISERLAGEDAWDVESALELQLDVRSLVWRDIRAEVLGAPRDDPRVRRAIDLLHDWDGELAPDSAPAAVFELFLAEITARAARAKAPRSAEWALGKGFNPLVAHTYVGLRHAGHVARLLRERPAGWFAHGWDVEVASALAAVVERLEREHGPEPAGWEWGRLRPLVLRHPFGGRRPFDRAFNLGPLACGGDTNTVAQASSPPLDPLGDPLYLATLRFAVDVGEWDRSRFVLAGGQSGNPLSPHYADQFEHWRRGEAIPLPFSETAVAAATRSTLRLEPRASG